MTIHSIAQPPLSWRPGFSGDARTQCAALCYRIARGRPELLLITSRGSGRWIIPKGWPIDGRSPGESALIEAWEEAGVIGRVHETCIGFFSYQKSRAAEGGLPCVGLVYPVRVQRLAHDYPEKGQRQRKWLRPGKAAKLVEEPELALILRWFRSYMAGA